MRDEVLPVQRRVHGGRGDRASHLPLSRQVLAHLLTRVRLRFCHLQQRVSPACVQLHPAEAHHRPPARHLRYVTLTLTLTFILGVLWV